MKHTELMAVLKTSGLKLHKSRLAFLSLLMMAVVQAKTVNLVSLVGMMEGRAQADSLYRRAQRFFRELCLSDETVAHYVLKLHPQKSYSLCLDRTNWQFGKLHINILTLAYAHEGVAVPLLWCLLPKDRLEVLLADREFIGGDWFAYLERQHIPSVIRVCYPRA